ncbi:MAG TPA: rRNA adenine N-6-methyltransferase family protein, partial [Fibrobacteraceae bacterium]|nr:rRNA adenine N-6-methyltransferase family protein [Fibrobacteraceae bacterium]
ASRLCAAPGSRDYGSLSVLVASYCHASLLRKIGPEHFTPQPHVDSATVLLTPLPTPLPVESDFFDFVQICFTHKRKSLTNSIVGPWSRSRIKEVLAKLEWPEHTRAEELSPQQFLIFRQALALASED